MSFDGTNQFSNVSIFQGIFAVFGRFVCSRGTSAQDSLQKEDHGPGWLIIVAFTIVFLGTYPLHMYVAEIYLKTDFNFLFVKYFVGFLYVILIPMITLIAQREIRQGVMSVLKSKNDQNNSTSCEALDELPKMD